VRTLGDILHPALDLPKYILKNTYSSSTAIFIGCLSEYNHLEFDSFGNPSRKFNHFNFRIAEGIKLQVRYRAEHDSRAISSFSSAMKF
jgi:hypothetical protein